MRVEGMREWVVESLLPIISIEEIASNKRRGDSFRRLRIEPGGSWKITYRNNCGLTDRRCSSFDDFMAFANFNGP